MDLPLREMPAWPIDENAALPQGFRAGAVASGIRRKPGRLDLGLILADAPSPAAAIYTRNRQRGVHVQTSREHLAASGGLVRALLVNSGIANCSTGEQGLADARAVCGALAETIGCPVEQVLFLSTGIIGARLPVDRIVEYVPGLAREVSTEGLMEFAQAIMTTDTHPKIRTRRVLGSEDTEVSITGVAKGAGMIHPDMATMLGFLLTDAAVDDAEGSSAGMPALLRSVADKSFHRVTVDGDTSPNDMVLLWSRASGRALRRTDFDQHVTGVARDLARMIASDGEGATRLVTIAVRGAPSEEAATRVGRVIATSPLVKTAVNGRDPNWGRILAAAGRAGVEFDPERARVWIGDAVLFSDGLPHADAEASAHEHMLSSREVVLGIDLACGGGAADVWTCDLSSDYVRINADYRT